MNTKLILVLAVVILLGGGIYLASKQNAPAPSAVPIGDTQTQEINVEEDTSTSDEEETNGTEAMEKGEVKSFTVEGSNFKFSVPEIRVDKGDTVKVTFVNKEGTHDWVVDGISSARTKQLQAGESETVTFVADTAGTFEYYCSVGQHRALGMKGNLIVEE